jgi:hypothetical protein
MELLIVGNGLKYPLIVSESKRFRAIRHRGSNVGAEKTVRRSLRFSRKGRKNVW